MPCSDSSSSIALRLNNNECFSSFEFAKISCGKELTAQTDYNDYCRGKTLSEILAISYGDAVENLKIESEEDRFILYLQWDALRSAIAQYLGVDNDDIDRDRCQITSITHDENGTEIAQVILPPKEMPNILPCNHSDKFS